MRDIRTNSINNNHPKKTLLSDNFPASDDFNVNHSPPNKTKNLKKPSLLMAVLPLAACGGGSSGGGGITTTAPPAPAGNVSPTGLVTITGTVTEDQVLTASNTLADGDGLGTISYQWQRGGTDISGANASTYTITQSDVGTAITVAATYTDGGGTAESKASSATGAVVNVNDNPTGSVTISGTVTEDQVLTALNTIADEDCLGTISYQWQR